MAKSTYLKVRANSLAAGGHPPVAGFTIPVLDGLEGAYLFSGGVDLATHNYATGEVDGTVVDGITAVDRYVRFGFGEGIVTPHLEQAAVSFVFIGRRGTLSDPAGFVQSATVGGSRGVSVYVPGSSMSLLVETTAGDVLVQLTGGNTVAWGLYVATVPATGGLYNLRNLTLGLSVTSASTADRVVTGTETYTIGDTQQSWSSDMLCGLIYSRVLTQGEIDALEIWARAYAADFGITV